jgi:hypothetical protein
MPLQRLNADLRCFEASQFRIFGFSSLVVAPSFLDSRLRGNDTLCCPSHRALRHSNAEGESQEAGPQERQIPGTMLRFRSSVLVQDDLNVIWDLRRGGGRAPARAMDGAVGRGLLVAARLGSNLRVSVSRRVSKPLTGRKTYT